MKQAVRVGLISAFLSIACLIAEMQAPRGTLTATFHYASVIIFLGGVFLAIKRTRDVEKEGFIDFKGGLRAGLVGGGIASLLTGIYQYIAFTYTDIDAYIAELKMNGANRHDILKAMENMTNHNFIQAAFFVITIQLVLTFLISIGAALVLRRTGQGL